MASGGDGGGRGAGDLRGVALPGLNAVTVVPYTPFMCDHVNTQYMLQSTESNFHYVYRYTRAHGIYA